MNEPTSKVMDELCEIIKKMVSAANQKERLLLGFDALNAIGELVTSVVEQTTPKQEGRNE